MKWLIVVFGMLSLSALSGCTPIGVVVGGVAAAGVVAVEERSVTDAIKDAEIKVDILNKLLQEDENLFADVSTIVIEGRVLVTGEVRSEVDRSWVSEAIWSIDGVKEVLNELQISDHSTLGSSAEDSWISAKLRARLIQDSSIWHVNYSIDTVNRIVYLMGIAQDEAELERVILQARDIAGVRKIVSHVVMKNSRNVK